MKEQKDPLNYHTHHSSTDELANSSDTLATLSLTKASFLLVEGERQKEVGDTGNQDLSGTSS